MEKVRDGLALAGVDQSKYCGHSFPIGAATTAAKKGMEDCIIKILGRWESLAYLQYVRLPREQLGGYSKVLASEGVYSQTANCVPLDCWSILYRCSCNCCCFVIGLLAV